MKRLVIYVHGKGGNAAESKHYQSLFADIDVIGLDYKSVMLQYGWYIEFPTKEIYVYKSTNNRLVNILILRKADSFSCKTF